MLRSGTLSAFRSPCGESSSYRSADRPQIAEESADRRDVSPCRKHPVGLRRTRPPARPWKTSSHSASRRSSQYRLASTRRRPCSRDTRRRIADRLLELLQPSPERRATRRSGPCSRRAPPSSGPLLAEAEVRSISPSASSDRPSNNASRARVTATYHSCAGRFRSSAVALPGRALLARPGGHRALTATPGAEAPFEGSLWSAASRCELGDLGRDRGAFRVAVRSPDHNVPGVECVGECRWIGESARHLDRRQLTECVGALTAPGDAGHDHSATSGGRSCRRSLSPESRPGRSPRPSAHRLQLCHAAPLPPPPSRRGIHLGPLNEPGPRVSAVGTAPVSSEGRPHGADSGG